MVEDKEVRMARTKRSGDKVQRIEDAELDALMPRLPQVRTSHLVRRKKGRIKAEFELDELGIVRVDKVMFVHEYAHCMDATQAAINVGVPREQAVRKAQQWLRDPAVINGINEVLSKRIERLSFGNDAILAELTKIAFASVSDLFNEYGRLMNLGELPDHVSAAIESIEYDVTKTGKRFVKKIKMHPKLEALKVLLAEINRGKPTKVDVSVTGSVEHQHDFDAAKMNNEQLAGLLRAMGIEMHSDASMLRLPARECSGAVIDADYEEIGRETGDDDED